jgi:hypothetical protein
MKDGGDIFGLDLWQNWQVRANPRKYSFLEMRDQDAPFKCGFVILTVHSSSNHPIFGMITI